MKVEVLGHEQNVRRVLWAEDVSDEIEFFYYTRQIFAAKSSQTCAKFAVQNVKRYNKYDFSQAAEVVCDSVSVVDFLKSFASVDKAIEKKLVEMMKRGGLKVLLILGSLRDNLFLSFVVFRMIFRPS